MLFSNNLSRVAVLLLLKCPFSKQKFQNLDFSNPLALAFTLCADLFLNQKFDFIRNWNKNYGILVGGKDI